MTLDELEREIQRRLEEQRYPAAERLLVTIDGPCASGKTTLAKKLAEVFGATVVHTDEYVIPHGGKKHRRDWQFRAVTATWSG